MSKDQKVSKTNRAGQFISSTAQKLWDRAFQKALKQYGKKSQAERIANCVVQPESVVRPMEPAKTVSLPRKRSPRAPAPVARKSVRATSAKPVKRRKAA